jgi:tripartite ATP-independent transporter DctM subunit
MTFKRFMSALVASGVATGVVMLVIMGSAVIGWLMTFSQIPQTFATWCVETLKDPHLIILAMIGVMLVVGLFIDLPAAILLLGPIFVPLAKLIGLDLLQLGLVMVLTLALGLYTPPVGTTLFISSSVAKTTILQTTKELWPFYLVALVSIFLFAYFPLLTIR